MASKFWVSDKLPCPYKYVVVFTVRCYAERGIVMANRLSVCQSITLRYCGHIHTQITHKFY